MGIQVGSVGPPIPQQAAQKMSDEQWLRAIAKHNGEETNWSAFTGGAQEMARVLEQETIADPGRFIDLGMRLDASSHPAYLDSLLHGLRQTTDVEPERVYDFMRHVASLGRPDHDRWLPNALTGRLSEDVPDDIIALILDKALHSPSPADEAWQRPGWNGEPLYGGDPFSAGMNSDRGAAALTLGDLLVHDADGHRTALIEPAFSELARDPSLAVRTCVAHVLAAGLRHARASVIKVFPRLLDAPGELLAARTVEELIIYIGFSDSELIEPVIRRMLESDIDNVREAGGRLAAFAGLEFEMRDVLDTAIGSHDPTIRKGAATICSHRLPITADVPAASAALTTLVDDPDEAVRKEAAAVAGALRNRPLFRTHRGSRQADRLGSVCRRSCPALDHSGTEHRARRGLSILAVARRFIDVFGGELESIASGAAGDARQVGELVLRAYSQAPDAEARAAAARSDRRTPRQGGL